MMTFLVYIRKATAVVATLRQTTMATMTVGTLESNDPGGSSEASAMVCFPPSRTVGLLEVGPVMLPCQRSRLECTGGCWFSLLCQQICVLAQHICVQVVTGVRLGTEKHFSGCPRIFQASKSSEGDQPLELHFS